MAIFKFRWPGQGDQPAENPTRRSRILQTETVEVMRRRARHRLIGAAVLVLVGVVGFPLLFDTQPRPVAVNIPIEIPDRNKVAPLVIPAPAAHDNTAKAASPVTPQPTPSRSAASRSAVSSNGVTEGEELVPASRSAPPKPSPAVVALPKVAIKTEVKPEPKADAKAESKSEAKPEPKPNTVVAVESSTARQEDAARAKALLEGRSAGSPVGKAEDGRFIVQVGAFADIEKAREVRAKVERAGLKTYTQVVNTKEGERTRVRAGPYTSRAEADKAVARIKALGLPASALTL